MYCTWPIAAKNLTVRLRNREIYSKTFDFSYYENVLENSRCESNKSIDRRKNTKQTIRIKIWNQHFIYIDVCRERVSFYCFSDVHDFLGDQVRCIERLDLCELDAQRGETRHDLWRERESGEQDAAERMKTSRGK